MYRGGGHSRLEGWIVPLPAENRALPSSFCCRTPPSHTSAFSSHPWELEETRCRSCSPEWWGSPALMSVTQVQSESRVVSRRRSACSNTTAEGVSLQRDGSQGKFGIIHAFIFLFFLFSACVCFCSTFWGHTREKWTWRRKPFFDANKVLLSKKRFVWTIIFLYLPTQM